MNSTFQQIRYPVILLLCFTLIFQPELAEQANGQSYILGNDVLAQAKDSPTPQYLLYDGHGSVRQLTNSSGAVVESYSYDAYGNARFDTSSASTNLLYAGI